MIQKFASLVLLASFVSVVFGQDMTALPPPPSPGWCVLDHILLRLTAFIIYRCGKYYMAGSPYYPLYGQFDMPALLDYPVMRLGCAQTITPYLEGETIGSVIIDTTLSNLNLSNSKPFSDFSSELLTITVSYEGRELAAGFVQPNSSQELEFSLESFVPRFGAYNLTCSAKTLQGELFSTTANLSYLPEQKNGSVTKRDARTGFPLVKDESGNYEPF